VSGDARDRFEERAGTITVLLVVTVIVAVGALIAQRGGPAPPASLRAPVQVKSLPLGDSLTPQQLLTGNASTFDHGLGGWTGTHGVVADVPQGRHGGGALSAAPSGVAHLAAPAFGPSAGAAVSPSAGPAVSPSSSSYVKAAAAAAAGSMEVWSPVVPATPGDRYVGSAYARAAGGAAELRMVMRFIDRAGKVTDTEAGQLTSDTHRWRLLPAVAAISPRTTAKVQLGVAFGSPAAGVQLVDDASIARTPGGHARVVGPLHTRGTQIIDGDGHPLILRGIQRFGLEGGNDNPLPTQAEIQQLSLWGANVVRLSLGEQKWLQSSCQYEPRYPQIVDRVVHWITSRGMVALLNLHFATAGMCIKPTLIPMADSPGSITFWQEVANRYKNNGLVAFDLFNEPYVPQSVWLNGGTFVFDKRVIPAVGMQQLYDAVRATGAQNLVVISGLVYSSYAVTRFVEGTNIVYGPHVYTCPTVAPPYCNNQDPANPVPIISRWLDVGKRYPMMITEFGWPTTDSSAFNANVIHFAEVHHWSWSAFAWDGGTNGLFDLVQPHKASDGTTIEPNQSGMPLVAGFALNWPAQP
jgi:hypothetical protein